MDYLVGGANRLAAGKITAYQHKTGPIGALWVKSLSFQHHPGAIRRHIEISVFRAGSQFVQGQADIFRRGSFLRRQTIDPAFRSEKRRKK